MTLDVYIISILCIDLELFYSSSEDMADYKPVHQLQPDQDVKEDAKEVQARLADLEAYFDLEAIHSNHYPNPFHVDCPNASTQSTLEEELLQAVNKITRTHESMLEETRVLTQHYIFPGLNELGKETASIAKLIREHVNVTKDTPLEEALNKLNSVITDSSDLLQRKVWQTLWLGRELDKEDELWQIGVFPRHIESNRVHGVKDRIKWAKQREQLLKKEWKKKQLSEKERAQLKESLQFCHTDPNTTIWDPGCSPLHNKWQRFLYHLNKIVADNFSAVDRNPTTYAESPMYRHEEHDIACNLYAFILNSMFRGTGVVDLDNKLELYYFDCFVQAVKNYTLQGYISLEGVYEYIAEMLYLQACGDDFHADETISWEDKQLGIMIQAFNYLMKYQKTSREETILHHFPSKNTPEIEELLQVLNNIRAQSCRCPFHKGQPATTTYSASLSPPPAYQMIRRHLITTTAEVTPALIQLEFIATIIYRVLLRINNGLTPYTPLTYNDESNFCEEHNLDMSAKEVEFLENHHAGLNPQWTPEQIRRCVEKIQAHRRATCICRYHRKLRGDQCIVFCLSADHQAFPHHLKDLKLDYFGDQNQEVQEYEQPDGDGTGTRPKPVVIIPAGAEEDDEEDIHYPDGNYENDWPEEEWIEGELEANTVSKQDVKQEPQEQLVCVPLTEEMKMQVRDKITSIIGEKVFCVEDSDDSDFAAQFRKLEIVMLPVPTEKTSAGLLFVPIVNNKTAQVENLTVDPKEEPATNDETTAITTVVELGPDGRVLHQVDTEDEEVYEDVDEDNTLPLLVSPSPITKAITKYYHFHDGYADYFESDADLQEAVDLCENHDVTPHHFSTFDVDRAMTQARALHDQIFEDFQELCNADANLMVHCMHFANEQYDQLCDLYREKVDATLTTMGERIHKAVDFITEKRSVYDQFIGLPKPPNQDFWDSYTLPIEVKMPDILTENEKAVPAVAPPMGLAPILPQVINADDPDGFNRVITALKKHNLKKSSLPSLWCCAKQDDDICYPEEEPKTCKVVDNEVYTFYAAVQTAELASCGEFCDDVVVSHQLLDEVPTALIEEAKKETEEGNEEGEIYTSMVENVLKEDDTEDSTTNNDENDSDNILETIL